MAAPNRRGHRVKPKPVVAPFLPLVPVMRWNTWLKCIGVGHRTGAMWRSRGWVAPDRTINGRNYISAEAVASFAEKVKAGKFA